MHKLLIILFMAVSHSICSQDAEERKLDTYHKKTAYDKIRKPATYNPYAHINPDGSVDWRAISVYYDEKNFVFRNYKSKAEVYRYVNNPNFLKHGEVFFIEEGSIISTYVFKDGKLKKDAKPHG